MFRPLSPAFLALLCLIGTFYCIYETILNLAFILPFTGITAELYKEKKENTMYKVVTKNNHNEVWASGFHSKERAESLIKEGYFHRYMYECDKCKELEVIEYN